MNQNNNQTNSTSGTTNNSNAKWIAGIVGATILGGAALFNLSGLSNIQQARFNQDEDAPSSCQYSCSGQDRDCSDFSTQQEAQDFFECCGFTANNDPMKLDGIKVDDGIACESLP